MPVKSPLKSKTLWVNFLMAGLAFFPSVSAMFSSEQILLGVSIVNMVLRLISKDKIGLE